MIHSGAVVAAGVSQGRSTTLGFDLGVMSTSVLYINKIKCQLIYCCCP